MIDIDDLTVEANEINSLIIGLEDIVEERIYSVGSTKSEDLNFIVALIRSVRKLANKHARDVEKLGLESRENDYEMMRAVRDGSLGCIFDNLTRIKGDIQAVSDSLCIDE